MVCVREMDEVSQSDSMLRTHGFFFIYLVWVSYLFKAGLFFYCLI